MGRYKNWQWTDSYQYRAVEGDTFDSIALQAYGNAHLDSLLIQENIQYAERLRFEGGEIITIPIIDLAASTRMPPWKRGA